LCGKNVREAGAEEGAGEGDGFDSTILVCEFAAATPMLNNMLKTRAVFFNGIPHVSDVFRREIGPASTDESGLLRKKRRKVQNASVIAAVQSVL
jgi:hypothetical protein